MEVVFPHPKFIEKLDKFNKHHLKHILLLKITTADPAVSRTLPIEAMIHQWVPTFFGNISRLPELSVKNQLVVRQLIVKTLDSNSWFVAVRKLCFMYCLSDS